MISRRVLVGWVNTPELYSHFHRKGLTKISDTTIYRAVSDTNTLQVVEKLRITCFESCEGVVDNFSFSQGF